MNTLRQSIANKDATKASEDYVDVNNDKQTAYNNAVAAAETIINVIVIKNESNKSLHKKQSKSVENGT
ncbi:FIVAR domain-containing protein [Staphylococcus aureus]